jgi:organic radical activating enzyme
MKLIDALRALIPLIAVETNGTQAVPDSWRTKLWLTMSPKVAPRHIRLSPPDELKVVYPDYNPIIYLPFTRDWTKLYIQPKATCDITTVGKSLIAQDALTRAAQFVLEHPEWRLSLQTHKLIGLP